jgi:hypothetical protein
VRNNEMFKWLKEWTLALILPWCFCVMAFVMTHKEIDQLFGTHQVPAELNLLVDNIMQIWLLCSMSGAFFNILFQNWRKKKRRN